MNFPSSVASKPERVRPADVRQIRIRDATWKRIQEQADRYEQSPSAMVRRWVIEGLNRMESGA
jgi:hypothetical protein